MFLGPCTTPIHRFQPMAGETPRKGSVFAWQGVSYCINKGKTSKRILQDISGELNSGELCAIIGPSGSGKTSLLNILAGRIQSKGSVREVTGNIQLDAQPLVGVALRKRIAYVKQEDLMTATYTPREAMLFSATLRLPRSMPLADKKAKVEKMLEDLGLLGCADTYCGDDMLRGISGGEKKRTCIGIELVMDPKLVFLDEPTSGLDSFSAYSVVKQLDQLSSTEGCNVLCTIHQPSSEVFHLFHKVIALIPGNRLFFGSVSELSEKMSTCGYGCPNEYNLADHVMFLIQTKPHNELLELANRMDSGVQPALQEDDAKAPLSKQEAAAGFFGQLKALSVREFLGLWRNKPALIASVIIPAVLNFFFAMIFFQVGDINADNYDAQSHFGGMTQVAIGGMFRAAQPLLLRFPLDRGIFLREYATGTYGAAPYFISKSMVEIPQAFLNGAIVWLVSYWMMALNGNFFIYVLVFALSGTAAASTALLVGCLASNPEVANQAAPAIFVPQLLFAGFFIRAEQIQDWLSWVQYICSLKYAMNLFVLNEFGSSSYDSSRPAMVEMVHESIINQNDIDPDNWWLYYVILLALVVVFRALSIAALAWRASTYF